MPIGAKLDHTPVLLSEVLDILSPKSGESYLDLTAGYGGHAASILDKTKSPKRAVLVDRDEAAINALEAKFPEAQINRQDFFAASQRLKDEGEQFDLILADLGVSSVHLNDSSRGFSFQSDSPLDMRMDQNQKLDAGYVVNRYSEKELTRLLIDFGEEPKAHQIARTITRSRPVKTTRQLAEIAKRVWPGKSRIHPATRMFQAIRIEVNDELGQLKASLPIWRDLLTSNGRLAVISFHSIEDGIVKRFLADNSTGLDAELRLLTKKPVMAGKDEIAFNPRARSAKLRAVAKINNNYLP